MSVKVWLGAQTKLSLSFLKPRRQSKQLFIESRLPFSFLLKDQPQHQASDTTLPPYLSKENLLPGTMSVKKSMLWRLSMVGVSSHLIYIHEHTVFLLPISISAHTIFPSSNSLHISLFTLLPLLAYRHLVWFHCPHNDPCGPSFEVLSLTRSHKRILNERYINGQSKHGMQIQKLCSVGFRIYGKMRCRVLVWK